MTEPAAALPAAHGSFRHVLCGVDGTEHGLAAARAAARLAAPGGLLELVAVHDPARDVAAATAQAWLDAALAQAPAGLSTVARVLEGRPFERLLAELDRRRPSLTVVGSRNHLRTAGILAGSVTTFVLHASRTPVLVARGDVDGTWPQRIVVGVDGGTPSLAALAVARELAARDGATLAVVSAEHDWRLDLAQARAAAPELELVPGDPAHGLVDACEGADLLVVGSRGMRGLRSLGSVSERVAHEAACSVLVVRGRPAP